MKTTEITEKNLSKEELDQKIEHWRSQNPRKLGWIKQDDGKFTLTIETANVIEGELTSEDRLLILE